MTMHLIKLSVGPESLQDLIDWQQQRLHDQRRKKQPELMHITRHMPKRGEEVLDGGSIYWVIKGFVIARQRLLELRPITYNDTAHCGLIYAPEMIRVVPRPHRPFQGWRYLNPKDAPRDLRKGEEDMSDVLRRELGAAGLL